MPLRRDGPARDRAPRNTELAPSPALAPWVESYWFIRGGGAGAVTNRVLPDGCADVIVGLGDEPRPVVVGAMRSAAVILLCGQVDLFGIRFRPGSALAFLDTPLRDLTDRRLPLEDLWGAPADALGEAVTALAPEARVAWAERVLRHRLRSRARSRHADEALAVRAVGLLGSARGGAVRDVAASLGIEERRLQRLFDRHVGLSPKILGRVFRLRRAVRGLNLAGANRAQPSWAALACAAGYADQPHMIREFKALAGVTPARYALERRHVGFVQDRDARPT